MTAAGPNVGLESRLGELRADLRRHSPAPWLPTPREVAVRPLSVGTYHTNFLIDCAGVKSVARQCSESQWGCDPLSQLSRELEVLEALEDTGRAPRPLAMLPGRFPTLIESFIDGHPFAYGPDLDALSDSVAAVHRCALPSSPTFAPADAAQFLLENGSAWLARALHSGRDSAAIAVLQQFERRLQVRGIVALDAPAVLLHTDLIHSNVLVTGQGCAIVDWEGCRVGPAAWDLAYLFSPVTLKWSRYGALVSGLEQRRFVRRYAGLVGGDDDQIWDGIEVLLPYVVFRSLCWCAGYQASLGRGGPPRNLRSFTTSKFVRTFDHLF